MNEVQMFTNYIVNVSNVTIFQKILYCIDCAGVLQFLLLYKLDKSTKNRNINNPDSRKRNILENVDRII